MKKKHLFFGFAVLLVAAMFTLAGCDTDPETGKTLSYGNLKVVNEYTNNAIGNVQVLENNGTKVEWQAPTPVNIEHGTSQTYTDVPAGTWRIHAGGAYLNDVVISSGMTTTVTRTSGGNLVAGVPLP